jgi:peptide deformylase
MIVTDEAILRLPCSDASLEEAKVIIEQLERELKLSAERGQEGIGLAAPQINIQKRVAIVRIPTNNSGILSVNLVNCKIATGYDQAIFEQEGCLSFPGKSEKTLRYQEIHVVNNLVAPHSFIATGLMAVAIQHELNHLDNILLPDLAIKKYLTHNKSL